MKNVNFENSKIQKFSKFSFFIEKKYIDFSMKIFKFWAKIFSSKKKVGKIFSINYNFLSFQYFFMKVFLNEQA